VIVYLDTSAAVKLYVTEAGSEAVCHAVASASEAATSLLAYAEVEAAFARKYRMHEITAAELENIRHELDRDRAHFNQLPVGSETVRMAGNLAERFGLRGYDAVHLASAYLLSREIRFTVSFACFDLALNSAVSSLGLSLFVN